MRKGRRPIEFKGERGRGTETAVCACPNPGLSKLYIAERCQRKSKLRSISS